jgi:archaellum component FlaC
MLSDIGYIKACVDRVEKNLSKVDERYRNIAERLAKVEEAVANVTKRVDEL